MADCDALQVLMMVYVVWSQSKSCFTEQTNGVWGRLRLQSFPVGGFSSLNGSLVD